MSPFAHICYDLDAHLLSKDNAYMSCMQVGETRGEVAQEVRDHEEHYIIQELCNTQRSLYC